MKYALLISVLLLPAAVAEAQTCEPFSIAVVGDSRDGYDVFAENLRGINQMDPRPIALINSGDITADGASHQWMDHHLTLANAAPDSSIPPDATGIPRQSAFATDSTGTVWPDDGRIRYLPVMGNHDWHEGITSYHNLSLFFPWLTDISGADGEIGSYGPNGLYYYVVYQNAVFIVLDSDHPSDLQTEWLEGVLQKPELANKWKIPAFHHPPFPCGGNKSPFDEGLPWVRLFETYEVPLVLLGHTHTTERTCRMIDGTCVPDNVFGVVYLNSSGAGVSTRKVDRDLTDKLKFDGDSINYDCTEILEFGEAQHHFYSITIDGGVLRAEGYYHDQAQTQALPFDSVTLTNPALTNCGAAQDGDTGTPGGGGSGSGSGNDSNDNDPNGGGSDSGSGNSPDNNGGTPAPGAGAEPIVGNPVGVGCAVGAEAGLPGFALLVLVLLALMRRRPRYAG